MICTIASSLGLDPEIIVAPCANICRSASATVTGAAKEQADRQRTLIGASCSNQPRSWRSFNGDKSGMTPESGVRAGYDAKGRTQIVAVLAAISLLFSHLLHLLSGSLLPLDADLLTEGQEFLELRLAES